MSMALCLTLPSCSKDDDDSENKNPTEQKDDDPNKNEESEVIVNDDNKVTGASSVEEKDGKFTIDGIVYGPGSKDGELVVIGYNKDKLKGDATIYSKVNYKGKVYQVVSIEKDALSGSAITKVVISKGVKSIGEQAFKGCEKLTEVSIKDPDATFAGKDVFDHCTSLTKATLPANIKKLTAGLFNYCDKLTDVAIPSTVTELEGGVFQFCSSIKKVKLPDSITKWGNSIFYGCKSLTEVNIPTKVTHVPKSFVLDCTSLKKLTIPENITEIGDDAFGNTALEEFTLPKNVTTVGIRICRFCGKLKKFTFYNKVKSISDGFYDCNSLTDVVFHGTKADFDKTFIDFYGKVTVTCDDGKVTK